MTDLVYRTQDSVGHLRLNRPDRRNALTYDMLDALATALADARADPDVRALVLTGEGAGFCAGIDLSVMPIGETAAPPLEVKRIVTERIHPVLRAIERSEKPVIAAVNGAAVGAGMDLALTCDMRICARSARFSESYVKLGLVPGAGGAYHLPRLVGRGKALELLLTGDFVDAEEALRLGIANRVVDDDAVVDEATALAGKLAALPPLAVATIKRLTYESERVDLATALDLASSHVAELTGTSDTREAFAAALEKRDPVYSGS
jgi:enoyl-CoA hydratase/carnithine racemase